MTSNRVHIIGRKNSGKTTLIVDLVRHLSSQGVRVATVKHTHHRHELDTPGKDSHRHREAGAAVVGILSPGLNAAFWPSPADHDSERRYDDLPPSFAACDLLLVEGDSKTGAPKLEVWRPEVAEPPIAATDSGIRAVISDDELELPIDVWPRRDTAALAARVLRLIRAGSGGG
ncbi:MAG: molybdopterin-guanine dinucleotide biosynthesis protein B [Planctomycetaceae bacterium]